MVNALVFDTGPIISLALNNLLGILPALQRQFNGPFLIPPSVKRELVDRPIESRKFKFEALQVLSAIERGTLTVADVTAIRAQTLTLIDTANRAFAVRGSNLQIVHLAEMEALALAIARAAPALVVDERTTRLLVESPKLLQRILERKLDARITVNAAALREFQQLAKGVRFLRSTELAVIAYELGLLDPYVLKIPEARKQLLQGVLWGLKLAGCGIPQREIDTIVGMELA